MNKLFRKKYSSKLMKFLLTLLAFGFQSKVIQQMLYVHYNSEKILMFEVNDQA
jgi:hypothetical protein